MVLLLDPIGSLEFGDCTCFGSFVVVCLDPIVALEFGDVLALVVSFSCCCLLLDCFWIAFGVVHSCACGYKQIGLNVWIEL